MRAIFLAALRHPFAGRDSAKKLVAGSLLNLIPGVNLLALVRLASSGRLAAAFEIGKVWQDVRLLFPAYFPAVLAWLVALFAYALLLGGSRWPLAWILHGFLGCCLYLLFAALFGRVGSRTRLLRVTYR